MKPFPANRFLYGESLAAPPKSLKNRTWYRPSQITQVPQTEVFSILF
jgi:hypothetical protein